MDDNIKTVGLSINIDDYVQVNLLDKEEFAQVLYIAKGSFRSMQEYAFDCGVSPATFSRYKNRRITRPINKERLLRMAEEAKPDDTDLQKDTILLHFLRANGMMDKHEISIKSDSNGLMAKVELHKLSSKVRDIIIEDLFKQNFVQYDKSMVGPERHMSWSGNTHKFIVTDSRGFSRRLCYQILSTLPKDVTLAYETKAPAEEVRRLLEESTIFFLLSNWLKDVHICFVLNDEAVYDEFVKQVQCPVDSEMTAMLVDIDAGAVVCKQRLSINDSDAGPSLSTR